MPNSTLTHELFIKRCLELASMGLGHVAPNPMVGAVIVYKDMVIGEGYHMQFGREHAEVNAINAVKDQSLLEKGTLYVNLEPCVHTGKTPPCCDLIVLKKIRKVVIGTSDPNPVVGGNGIEMLRKNGVEVIVDVLKEECVALNRRFFTFYNKERPYIILKWAQTVDGFMDFNRKPGEAVGVNWISNKLSQTLVHKWRAEEQAIMVGTNTVILDNPRLTVRHWTGSNPLRVIIDRTLRIPFDYHVMENTLPTIVFNEKKSEAVKNIRYIKIDFSNSMFTQLFGELCVLNIQSILVEGGKKLIESLIKENLWDEARVIVGDKNFRSGYLAPVLHQKPESTANILNDQLLCFRNGNR